MDDLFVKENIPYKNGAVIKVVGVGGCGGNAVANMVAANIGGNVEYIAINTDSQALADVKAQTSILIGTTGLGAGGDPERAKSYALDSVEEIREALKGADMVFITCGMGGGTGTGASPVVAAEAKSAGALTVAVVYTPYTSTGKRRVDIAKAGLESLVQYVDSYIVVSNDGMQEVGRKLTHRDVLRIADDILRQSIQGVCEIAGKNGYINIDFADIRSAMTEKGKAVMGIGVAKGENRARAAFENALKSPLLIDTSIKGAYAVLINITGNEEDLLNDEVTEILDYVMEEAGESVWMFDGVSYDDRTDKSISVTIVATGISAAKNNVTRIETIKSQKPSPVALGINNRIKQTVRNDKNLNTMETGNEEYFEIPTYLRKQVD